MKPSDSPALKTIASAKPNPAQWGLVSKGRGSKGQVPTRRVGSGHNIVFLSTLSHASFAAFFLIGPLTLAVPLVIWLLERNRPKPSVTVEFHARQALFYQLAVYLSTLILLGITALLVVIVIGLFLTPFIILAFLAAVGYAVYGSVKVWKGKRFKYWVLTDFIERKRRA